MKQPLPAPEGKDILWLTKAGERELNEPGTTLTPAQLEALVLIDGHSSLAQVLQRTTKVGREVLLASLHELIGKGLVSAAPVPAEVLDPGDFFTLPSVPVSRVEAGSQSLADVDANTDFLRRNGYCVNLARRPVVNRVRADERNLTVLVIDDDPDICKLLQAYLKLEGIHSRTASNREGIVAALRSQPLPDMVLLDVHLTDVNGFDVLLKMRQHPALKELPVIMLTAEANREAVLKGILGGADGYVTKPFEIHPLIRAVKTVLGLKYDAHDPDWDYSH